MKKLIVVSILLLGLSITPLFSDYQAEGSKKEVTYKTCKELYVHYSNGVSAKKDTANSVTNRKTKEVTKKKTKAYVSANLYKLNKKLDTDNDGIACEK